MSQFPTQSAGRVLTRNVPIVSPDNRVRDVLSLLRKQATPHESISYTYALSNKGKLKGILSIKSLLKAQDQQRIKNIMTKQFVSVHPYTDQEKAAILAIRHNIKAVPVVDKQGYFLGIVTTDKILETLHTEHIEDILKLSGLNVGLLDEKNGIHTYASIRIRLPWLTLGMIGGLGSTWVVSQFSATMQLLLSLAFFMPIVTYMSGAISNQSQSMLIRNLLIQGLNIKRYLVRELLIGALLGTIYGVLIGGIGSIITNTPEIAVIISISMPINAMLSILVSVLVPWALTKLDKDPAIAAGPFSIVVQDMISLVVYFSLATLIVSN